MKKLKTGYFFLMVATLLLAASSCKKEDVDENHIETSIPANVHLSEYSKNSITVSWDLVENASSYTIELLSDPQSEKTLDAYTTISKNLYQFTGLDEIAGYYIRVRANFNTVDNPVLGDWAYIMDGAAPGRIMPKYGFVSQDFVEPPAAETLLYPDFPEGFEVHEGDRKKSYTAEGPTGRQSDLFPTGEWLMNQAYTTNSGTALIHKVGDYATMMANNQEGYLAMDFDLPLGASKLTFVCGAATRTNANETTGMPIVLSVSFSVDGGLSWTKLGDDVRIEDIETQYTPVFDNLNIAVPVRFKITKNSSKARPIIDEVAVYYTN